MQESEDIVLPLEQELKLYDQYIKGKDLNLSYNLEEPLDGQGLTNDSFSKNGVSFNSQHNLQQFYNSLSQLHNSKNFN